MESGDVVVTGSVMDQMTQLQVDCVSDDTRPGRWSGSSSFTVFD